MISWLLDDKVSYILSDNMAVVTSTTWGTEWSGVFCQKQSNTGHSTGVVETGRGGGQSRTWRGMDSFGSCLQAAKIWQGCVQFKDNLVHSKTSSDIKLHLKTTAVTISRLIDGLSKESQLPTIMIFWMHCATKYLLFPTLLNIYNSYFSLSLMM